MKKRAKSFWAGVFIIAFMACCTPLIYRALDYEAGRHVSPDAGRAEQLAITSDFVATASTGNLGNAVEVER